MQVGFAPRLRPVCSAGLYMCKSVRKLAEELKAQGHQTSHRMVAELLHDLGYSLQANQKTLEGSEHADRNAQFEYLNGAVQQQLWAGEPTISVDTKKKLRHEVARSEWTRK